MLNGDMIGVTTIKKHKIHFDVIQKGSTIEILLFAILKRYQNQGFGNLLLALTIHMIQNQYDAQEIVVRSMPESQAFWRNAGFVIKKLQNAKQKTEFLKNNIRFGDHCILMHCNAKKMQHFKVEDKINKCARTIHYTSDVISKVFWKKDVPNKCK